MSPQDPSAKRRENLLTIAKTFQECQRILDHYGLSEVALAVEPAITALQRHVEFEHAPPTDLLEEFGLDDLGDADEWWKKKPKDE